MRRCAALPSVWRDDNARPLEPLANTGSRFGARWPRGNLSRSLLVLAALLLPAIPHDAAAQRGASSEHAEVYFRISAADKRDARKRRLNSAEAIILRSRHLCYEKHQPDFQEIQCGITSRQELRRLQEAEFNIDDVTRHEIRSSFPMIALILYKPADGSRWSVDVLLPDIEG